jgi:hypothetical protein
MLPAGFQYVSFGWTGDVMSNGTPTPGAHDGMACPRRRRRAGPAHGAVRNHELGRGVPFSATYYDAQAAGGTVNLEFDTRRGTLVESWPPRGLTVMLSGAFSTSAPGDSNSSSIVSRFWSYIQICPWRVAPPLVDTM